MRSMVQKDVLLYLKLFLVSLYDFIWSHLFIWCHCLHTDSVERFHISAFVLFVLAQNILEAEGPWFESFIFVSSMKLKFTKCLRETYFTENTFACSAFFDIIFFYILQNALLVYICEMVIDIIKHSFIAKFNGIKPIAYSEFLEDLCKQVHICRL